MNVCLSAIHFLSVVTLYLAQIPLSWLSNSTGKVGLDHVYAERLQSINDRRVQDVDTVGDVESVLGQEEMDRVLVSILVAQICFLNQHAFNSNHSQATLDLDPPGKGKGREMDVDIQDHVSNSASGSRNFDDAGPQKIDETVHEGPYTLAPTLVLKDPSPKDEIPEGKGKARARQADFEPDKVADILDYTR